MESHRILLVEDDTPTRWLLATALGPQLEIDVAESVREAKRLIDRFGAEYCCVLLDLDLPDGHGREVMAYARGCNTAPAVIVVSGTAGEEPVREFGDIVRLVIRKPVHAPGVRACIDEHCPRGHGRRAGS